MNLDKLYKVVDLLEDKINFEEFCVLAAVCNWPKFSSLWLASQIVDINYFDVEIILKDLVHRNVIKLIDDWEEKIDFELV